MTFSGDYYNYSFNETGVRCHKMDASMCKQFWLDYNLKKEPQLVSWSPVASEAKPWKENICIGLEKSRNY